MTITHDISEEFPIDLTGMNDTIASVTYAPPSVRWDCLIGGMPFLFGMSDQYPMIRETSEFRRQRIDNERDPGEQSLDSGYWIRSQSSWHYGSGISSAEPLETTDTESRFRFVSSGGVNPWTPGKLTLLNSTSNVYSSVATDQVLLGVDSGVIHTAGAVMKYITNAGSASTVTWGGTADILSLTSTGQYWIAADDDGIYKGSLPNGSGTKIYASKTTSDVNLVRWVKSRLMFACNNSLYEITNLAPSSSTLPASLFDHSNPSWIWTDFSDGVGAIYASGYAGDSSAIYKISVSTSTTAVTLDKPVVVADMPRGEIVLSMYSYLGAYLAIGTNKGLRIAAVNTDGSIALGPLVHETSDGVYDQVAVGNYLWFTVGSKGNAGNRVNRPGLYRVDLGTNLNNDPLDFAHAADLVTPSSVTTGQAKQVTVAGGKLWFTVSGSGVFKQNDTYVSEGWFETGRIRLGTLEPKAWRDIRIIAEQNMSGIITAYASTSDSNEPSTWNEIIQATGLNYDILGKLLTAASLPEPSMYVAYKLSTTDTSKTPTLLGYQVRAMPAPSRSRLTQLSLLCYDFEVDRQGMRFGQKGGAWARMSKLEELESNAATIVYYDYTTGERSEGYIERINYTRTTPPTRNTSGNGGIVRVTLRLLS